MQHTHTHCSAANSSFVPSEGIFSKSTFSGWFPIQFRASWLEIVTKSQMCYTCTIRLVQCCVSEATYRSFSILLHRHFVRYWFQTLICCYFNLFFFYFLSEHVFAISIIFKIFIIFPEKASQHKWLNSK